MLNLLADATSTTDTGGGAAATGGASVLFLLFLLLCFCLYWVPTIIAFSRHRNNVGTVVVVNLFFGWTFIGWVIALAMAFGSNQPPVALNLHLGNVAPAYHPGAHAGYHHAPPTVAAPPPQMSPDGSHYWDGRAWHPTGSQHPHSGPAAMRTIDAPMPDQTP